MGIAVGLMILLAFPIGKVEPAIATIKLPGAYPYEEPVRIPVLVIAEPSPAPSPAPFPYPESAPAQGHDSRVANTHRPLSPKTVREAAFKYNGVPSFLGFLAGLPADVSVFDPKLGRTRAVVKGGRAMPKNVTWLRQHKSAPDT
jgi:hypothetical protein